MNGEQVLAKLAREIAVGGETEMSRSLACIGVCDDTRHFGPSVRPRLTD